MTDQKTFKKKNPDEMTIDELKIAAFDLSQNIFVLQQGYQDLLGRINEKANEKGQEKKKT